MTGTSREISETVPMALDLPFSPESASVARQELVEWMSTLGAGDEHRDDARLVVSELVGNAVRHARPLADGTMRVAWTTIDSAVDIAVTDGGALTTPERVEAGVSDLAGRGLVDRRDACCPLVGREHPLPHHGARPARPRLRPTTRAPHRARTTAPVGPVYCSAHGQEVTSAPPHRSRRGRAGAAATGRRRSAPALPVRIGSPLQGVPRERGRGPCRLRRPSVRRPGGRGRPGGPARVRPGSHRTARAPRQTTARSGCARSCPPRHPHSSARTAPSGSGSRSSTRTATRAVTWPPC